jgi:hypothetical protein
VFSKGTPVMEIVNPPARMIEAFVQEARELALGNKIDWHYVGGRAVVKYLGNYGQVRSALDAALEHHRDSSWRVKFFNPW